jgi:hypothetical protein
MDLSMYNSNTSRSNQKNKQREPLSTPLHCLAMALLVRMGTGVLLFAALVAAMAFVF